MPVNNDSRTKRKLLSIVIKIIIFCLAAYGLYYSVSGMADKRGQPFFGQGEVVSESREEPNPKDENNLFFENPNWSLKKQYDGFEDTVSEELVSLFVINPNIFLGLRVACPAKNRVNIQFTYLDDSSEKTGFELHALPGGSAIVSSYRFDQERSYQYFYNTPQFINQLNMYFSDDPFIMDRPQWTSPIPLGMLIGSNLLRVKLNLYNGENPVVQINLRDKIIEDFISECIDVAIKNKHSFFSNPDKSRDHTTDNIPKEQFIANSVDASQVTKAVIPEEKSQVLDGERKDIKDAENKEPVEKLDYPKQLEEVIAPNDWSYVQSALSFAYSLGKDAQIVNWHNKKNGHKGAVLLTGLEANSKKCRQFRVTRLVNDNALIGYIEFCKDGTIK